MGDCGILSSQYVQELDRLSRFVSAAEESKERQVAQLQRAADGIRQGCECPQQCLCEDTALGFEQSARELDQRLRSLLAALDSWQPSKRGREWFPWSVLEQYSGRALVERVRYGQSEPEEAVAAFLSQKKITKGHEVTWACAARDALARELQEARETGANPSVLFTTQRNILFAQALRASRHGDVSEPSFDQQQRIREVLMRPDIIEIRDSSFGGPKKAANAALVELTGWGENDCRVRGRDTV